MKVSPIRPYKIQSLQKKNTQSTILPTIVKKNDYIKSNNLGLKTSFHTIQYKTYKTITFCGEPVHIVDGGNHSTNMQHFAKAISKDMDIDVYNVDINPNDENVKQLKSLEQQLKNLNNKQNLTNEYIAIPALASVPLLNLQDQYNRVMNENKKFTPENIKSNKQNVLTFLKKIYDSPYTYREYIKYMDPNEQGINYTYGVIDEINKLLTKGAKVYIPAGHPQDQTLKWMAEQKGLKPELYNFISTGIDKNNQIKKISEQIKSQNWYDFNLLSLSNAHVVGVKDATGAQDYMFAAYDTCVTDGARGVYNFSPVRQNNKLIGYSYTDTKTNEYPFNEFPANEKIANIVKFVGEKINDVIATEKEQDELKSNLIQSKSTLNCADKLYPVKNIFTTQELSDQKIYLQGDYTDKTRTLFFKTNQNNQVIFPKCDCEGSGKPSVLSMWGSCFAVFNAIKEDILLQKKAKENEKNYYSHYEEENDAYTNWTQNELAKAREAKIMLNYGLAKFIYNKLIDFNNETEQTHFQKIKIDNSPYILLGDILAKEEPNNASNCYNKYIDKECKQLINFLTSEDAERNEFSSLQDLKNSIKKNEILENQWLQYEKNISIYNKKSILGKMFMTYPQKPLFNKSKYIEAMDYYRKLKEITTTYQKIGKLCKEKGEFYPEKVCKWAAQEIENCTILGDKIIKLRADGIQYIGDLYNENN